MARPKRQQERRSQLVAAAQRAIAAHGPEGARLNRVAEEAGLTSGAVLYYYPDIDDLMFEANRAGMERFYEGRVRMLENLPDDIFDAEENPGVGDARYTAERFFRKRPDDYRLCVTLIAAVHPSASSRPSRMCVTGPSSMRGSSSHRRAWASTESRPHSAIAAR